VINKRKCIALLSSCVLLSLAGGTEAQASVPSHAASPFSMTISPTRLDVGQGEAHVTQRVEVVNGGRAPLAVSVEKENFTGADNGTMDFQARAPYSASNWVTVSPTRFVVAPGRTQVVTARISIPTDAEPGDHQVGLVFLVPAGRTRANIKINRGIAIPVYITAPGPISDTASINHLTAPGFETGGSVKVTAQVTDTGTVHRDFRGATALKLIGGGSAATFPDFTVPRGSTREISTTWHAPFMCLCQVSVSIPGPHGTKETASVQVIVIPAVPLGLGLAVVVLFAVAIRLARRRYRGSVLKAAARLGDAAHATEY
jgi:hypothetical protein